MRAKHNDDLGLRDGGAPPPITPDLFATDEGPMRAELLRQIRRLELEIGRFAVTNCPFDTVPEGRTRGPSILPTRELEEIRDELLEIRSALHELVIERATAKMTRPDRPPSVWARLRALAARLPRQDQEQELEPDGQAQP